MKKIFYLLLIILLSLITYLSIFDETSSNNLATINKKIEDSSFTGKEIFSSFENALAKPNRKFYTSIELESMINKNQHIILDKDVYSNFGIVLAGTKLIESDNIRKKIIFYKNSVSFFANNANITFKNIDFYIVDTLYFLNELENSKSKISFNNCRFFIEKNSSLDIFISELSIEQSLIYGNSNKIGPDAGLLILRDSKKVTLTENIFYDSMESIRYGVSLFNIENLDMKKNIIISHLDGLKAPLMIENGNKLDIIGNIFVDLNNGYREEDISKNEQEEEFLEGSIGLIARNGTELQIVDNYFYTDNTVFPLDINSINSVKVNNDFSFFLNKDLSLDCNLFKNLPPKFIENLNKRIIWGLKEINCK